LTAPIPNRAPVGVWRIEPDGHHERKGLAEDPVVTAAAEQARRS
jgi:hypothetical protein